jgi:hypothetical protein
MSFSIFSPFWMVRNVFTLYGGGGGGGGGDGGAQLMENQRQSRVRDAVDAINKIFNGAGRDKLYSEQKDAVYDLNKTDVDRQFKEAERANRFSLARNGLVGGSVDVESNEDLSRRTNEGLMKASGIAEQAAADLQASDERTRSNLISTAQSGIDTGQAASMALAQLDANNNNAAGARAGASVGGLFNDMAQAYLWNQQNKIGGTGGSPYSQQWFGVSSPMSTYQGS